MVSEFIITVIDFFYPPFRRIMPLQTFRYAACGGANVVQGFLLFTLVYSRLGNEVVSIGSQHFAAYTIALVISSCSVFVMGFLLNKYVVFTGSYLRGRIQLFRYLLSFLSNLAINYVLLKMFVQYLHFHPVLAQVLVTAFVIAFSYFTQQYFTFRMRKEGEEG